MDEKVSKAEIMDLCKGFWRHMKKIGRLREMMKGMKTYYAGEIKYEN